MAPRDDSTGAAALPPVMADGFAAEAVRSRHDSRSGHLMLPVCFVTHVSGPSTPNPFVVPGIALHEELPLLQDAGLRPYEALRTATDNPAAYLDEPDSGIGSEGGRADLLLLSENPLDDVRHVRRIASVLVGGTWISGAEIQELLDEATAAYTSGYEYR